MSHILYKDFSLPHLNNDIIYRIDIKPHISNYIKINKIKPTELLFSDIWYHSNRIVSEHRLNRANTYYPGIVVSDMPNPDNKKYRLIDGNHRLHQNILNHKDRGYFYIMSYEFILSHIIIDPIYN